MKLCIIHWKTVRLVEVIRFIDFIENWYRFWLCSYTSFHVCFISEPTNVYIFFFLEGLSFRVGMQFLEFVPNICSCCLCSKLSDWGCLYIRRVKSLFDFIGFLNYYYFYYHYLKTLDSNHLFFIISLDHQSVVQMDVWFIFSQVDWM